MATALADRWVVFGTEIPNPAHIRDARFAGAVYACRAAEARAVMRGTGLEPSPRAGGASRRWPASSTSTPTSAPTTRSRLQLLVRGPGGRIGLYTAELPVTGEFTLHAGRQIWGLPKWRARTESTFDGRGVRLKLWDGDTRVLAVALDGGPIAAPARDAVRCRCGVFASTDRTRANSCTAPSRFGSRACGSGRVAPGSPSADIGCRSSPVAWG